MNRNPKNDKRVNVSMTKSTHSPNQKSGHENVKRYRVITCRVVGRSNNNANANGGLVYTNANNASSNANTNNAARLANRQIENFKIIVPTARRFVQSGSRGRLTRTAVKAAHRAPEN